MVRDGGRFDYKGEVKIILKDGNYSVSFCVYVFLRPHMQHMEVPRMGVNVEMQVQASATTTATADPTCICNLHCSLLQRQIFNPLREARDGTCILTDTTLGP